MSDLLYVCLPVHSVLSDAAVAVHAAARRDSLFFTICISFRKISNFRNSGLDTVLPVRHNYGGARNWQGDNPEAGYR